MAALMRVFGCVPVRRLVTAQRHTTRLARAQMDPIPSDADARLAFVAQGSANRFDRTNVTADWTCRRHATNAKEWTVIGV